MWVYQNKPSNSCELPKIEKPQVKPLSESEQRAFLAAIQGHVHEDLYMVILFTGLREGEVLGLTWDCVDFKRGTILIVKQLRKEQKKDGKYYYSPPKNGISRVLTPAPFVMSILKAHKVRQAEQRLQLGDAWIDSNLVFTNQMGDHLSYRTVYDCFKRIVKKIGVPTARVHDLRHTYAVNALRAGDDIKTLQRNLRPCHSGVYTVGVRSFHIGDAARQRPAHGFFRKEGFQPIRGKLRGKYSQKQKEKP